MATSPFSWSSSTGTPRRSARRRKGRPLRRRPGSRSRHPHPLRGGAGRRRPWPFAPPRPRQRLYVRPLPEPDRLPRHDAELCLRPPARDQWRGGGVHPHPQGHGVAERVIRTLKEQVVWGRIFRNAEEVRAAVRAFVARYNEHWLLEKNAYRSPAQTRREWFAALAPIRAAA